MKNILNKTFDKIYVFNLDRRNDRWEDCKKIIDSTGLQLERMSAVDGETLKEEDLVMGLLDYIPKINLRGMQGCTMSHYNAIKKAKDEGHKNVLVFEDDFEFVDNFEELFTEYYAQVPHDWEFLYLGANHNFHMGELLPMVSKNVGKPHKSYCAHAYAVKECLYDFVLSLFDVKVTGTPGDVALSQAQSKLKNCYTLFPSVVTQRRGYSDIVCRDTNYKPYII